MVVWLSRGKDDKIESPIVVSQRKESNYSVGRVPD